MKISAFNKKAPKLIAYFSNMLEKLISNQVEGINFAELKAQLTNTATQNGIISEGLNSVNIETMMKLRKNAVAGDAYYKAVENSASLSNLVPVLQNILNGMEPVEDIDDILGKTGDKTCSTNGGTDGIQEESPKAEDAEEESTDGEAAVTEGSDVTNSDVTPEETELPAPSEDKTEDESDVLDLQPEDFDLTNTAPAAVKRKASQNKLGVNSLVPNDFLA